MITTGFRLCALPREMWEQDVSLDGRRIAIRSFVEDALGIKRRMAKGVNLENERVRYSLCCAGIEAAASQQQTEPADDAGQFSRTLEAHHLPIVALGAGYLDVLALVSQRLPVQSSETRLGATFFPPDKVEEHKTEFYAFAKESGLADHEVVQQRVAFFNLAHQFGCGVIELQNAFHSVAMREPILHAPVEDTHEVHFPPWPEDEEAVDNRGRNLHDILREQLREAIRDVREGRPGAVNFSNQPHNVITDVLHEFVYSEPAQTDGPLYIQVIYTDGSQAEPFPVRCLPRRADLASLRGSQPLRVALMSMRHLQMDHDVDMAWFRNREVSKSRTFAETDALCHLQTRKQLQEARGEGALRIHLYQTGLQPAVIGFYRALVEELMHRAHSPPSLEVIPYYYYRKEETCRPAKAWH